MRQAHYNYLRGVSEGAKTIDIASKLYNQSLSDREAELGGAPD
jgi:hypothetical protein